ncbi:MAG: hypothetical protein OHK0022_05750 [Roseiflexaceae bacterium]
MPRALGRDIEEIFGFAPDDLSENARSVWESTNCPFVGRPCIKYNHNRTICYGTCSVSSRTKSGNETVIVCPNRLYADRYKVLRSVAEDAFGREFPFYTYSEYVNNPLNIESCVVILGHNSGREIKLGASLSMDWIVARVENGRLVEYVGVEVQSIDISGNYRDTWQAYKELPENPNISIPTSAHGLNWANVHKRLIPQLIRKGLVYSRSSLVKRGLYFILPDRVYHEFEKVLGTLNAPETIDNTTMTVFTYDLGEPVASGFHRDLRHIRSLRFSLSDFSSQFIAGSNLSNASELDSLIRDTLDRR